MYYLVYLLQGHITHPTGGQLDVTETNQIHNSPSGQDIYDKLFVMDITGILLTSNVKQQSINVPLVGNM